MLFDYLESMYRHQFTFSRFARVGDNYILSPDPDEQTFRVSKIIKHGEFKPLGASNGGDGRHDIALVSVNLLFVIIKND